MELWIRRIDVLSKSIGHAFSWCVLILTASTCYEVFMRYVLNSPTVWAFDMSYMMYGALFMMSGAYAVSRNSHVRGDFLYRKWSNRTQAKVDLVLYLVFFFPAIFAMVFTGGQYAFESARILESSVNSPAGVPVWPLKTVIFVAGLTLLIAGAAELMRCLVCIRTGEWLPRSGDVEELEQTLIQQHTEKAAS
ncbi:TRAP transporter small permease subunit [Hydrogenophaga sp.]|jgi:TRAP-type mannitol/chloroaromatic compound transport system permease small subunit|uniref:TRAP transporter small permease subunit n=1 Tax=Hydrogenophaga sp. TaxID=1904254 RepID=UPI00261B7B75|nr:TRAP transporter small permease subunit [Hydrogenophaga sp.]MDM7948776.1 TRAP transporter small permease subunit [Hydrogenophaga sp.]